MYPKGYTNSMITLLQTTEFGDWLRELKDNIGKARILARLRSASLGHFGDSKPVGSGILEMRIHAGPGYRVYFARRGETVYLLRCGGDKATQAADIKRARSILKSLPPEAPHD